MDDKPRKINKLNTKYIPAILTLLSGAIVLVICLHGGYEFKYMIACILIAMIVFFFIGLLIKSIVDKFNMKAKFDDYFKNIHNDVVTKK